MTALSHRRQWSPPSSAAVNPRAAFTLPELLMVAGILAIVMAATFVTVLSGQSSFLSMDRSIQSQEEARRALDGMTRELRDAGGAIATPAAPAQQLDFQLALGYNLTNVCAASGDCCPADQVCWGAWDTSGKPQYKWKVRYALKTSRTATQLVRQLLFADAVVFGSERVLANYVDGATSSTSFGWDATNRVITLNLQTKTPFAALLPGGIRSSGHLTTQVKLRNS